MTGQLYKWECDYSEQLSDGGVYIYVGFKMRESSRVLNVLGQVKENLGVVKKCCGLVGVGLDPFFLQRLSKSLPLSCELSTVD